ncbi:MAG: hypothetical protein K0U36_01340, partial [Alphaproteobacteria bacterium]|nr:hypothetical protein [Alphaproteobacteria bacterium]
RQNLNVTPKTLIKDLISTAISDVEEPPDGLLVFRVDNENSLGIPGIDSDTRETHDQLGVDEIERATDISLNPDIPVCDQINEDDELIIAQRGTLCLSVKYQQDDFKLSDIPISILMERIFDWAIREAGILHEDAGDFELRYYPEADSDSLPIDKFFPVGHYAKLQEDGELCASFFLAPIERFQGSNNDIEITKSLCKAEKLGFVSDHSIEGDKIKLKLKTPAMNREWALEIDVSQPDLQLPETTVRKAENFPAGTNRGEKRLDGEKIYSGFDRHGSNSHPDWKSKHPNDCLRCDWKLFDYLSKLRDWLNI